MAIKGPTYRDVATLPAGKVLNDPFARGLRYIGGTKGSYAQVRYKHPKTGKWISHGLGRLPTQDELEERAIDREWGSVKPSDALEEFRDQARSITQKARKGIDPRTGIGAEGMRLSQALDLYEADLKARRVSNPGDIMSMLRRELLGPLGNMALDDLDRATLVRRIDEVREKPKLPRWPKGRPGAAKGLQLRTNVFLNFAVNQGHMKANPLAGYRKPRRTKAQIIARPGRALADAEIRPLWRACADVGAPFGPFLQILLLTGQRRTETTLMDWKHIDLKAGIWTIPTEITKSGREHRVPLPPLAKKVLRRLGPKPRGLVFAGDKGRPMAGWSPRMRDFRTDNPKLPRFTLHDLRRTVRTGMGKLGVDPTIAALMINHDIGDELRAIYDREEYWRERVKAAKAWGKHVEGLIAGKRKSDTTCPVSRFKAAGATLTDFR